MAMIKKDASTMAMPLSMQRTEPAPIDAYSIWYSLSEAQEYAAGTGTNKAAYVGQIITVVDEANNKATAYVIADTAGTLQEVGSGSSAPMLFVDDQAAMLALQDIEAGQQVYRSDTKTIWIFKGGDASQISNWVESAAQNDTVWSGTQDKVIFAATTQGQYDGLESKDNNTLYFITDTGRIYKGSIDLTESVIISSASISADAAIKNKLYVNPDTLVCSFTVDGVNWKQLIPGYLTDGANWASADSGKFATIGLIKKGIKEAIAAITFDNSTGTIKIADEGQGAILTGVAHNPSYDTEVRKLTIPVYGSETAVEVTIPDFKDKFVKTGEYHDDFEYPTGTHHYKVIVLTIENQVEPVIIPAEALVNIYTADNTDKNVKITVTEDNKISAMITLDPDTNNALKYDDTKGFIVNISGKLDKVTGAVENNLVSFGADGSVKDSGKKIGGDTLSTDANTVATEAAVVSALSWNQLPEG